MAPSWRRPLIGFLCLYLVGASIFLLSGGGGHSDNANSDLRDFPSESNEPLYLLEFSTFAGEESSLSIFAGRPLIVNFFASWCTPCVEEMPDFERLHQSRGDQLNILGLAVEGARPAREIVESTGVTYSVGLDEHNLLEELGGFAMPTTAFISKDGDLLESHSGVLDYSGLVVRVEELFSDE